MRNQERTLAPERTARLQAAHDAEISAKDDVIAKLKERLEIASRRLRGLMAEQKLGIPAVNRAMPKLPTSRPGLDKMARKMRLPVA